MGISPFRRVALLMALVVLLLPTPARAFCGFFVSGADGPLVNDATQVALMRSGLRTVLSMRNSYQGPLGDFALVIPVPVILQKENVKTLPPALFDRLGQLTAPRLVEYWEQNPCPEQELVTEDLPPDSKEGGTGTRAKGDEGSMGNPRPLVRVEAEFSVDEYDIVILSADDATALDVWLRQNGYRMPPRVEPFLRPYVAGGSKFFVARVNAAKVKFLWGRAVLSPLRFHYDSEKFELPIRLGLANADGPQDLLIYLLAPTGQRYEVANYDNLFLPTNLEVKNEVREKFPSFHAALFDRTVAGNPRAVVTEYAWSAGSCDPCPTPPLDDDALLRLGAETLGTKLPGDFAVTRLHARYSRDTLGDDLVFRPAPPVEGGNEVARDRALGSHGARPASQNSFQGRYIIRHPWQGPVACDDPEFGVWGGPPEGVSPPPPAPADPTVRRDLPLDELILARPEMGSDRLSLATRAVFALRRLVLRPPTLAVLGALLGLPAVLFALLKLGARIRFLWGFVLLCAAPLLVLIPDAFSYSSPYRSWPPLLLLRSAWESFREVPFRFALFGLHEAAAAVVVVWLAARSVGRKPAGWVGLLAALAPLVAGGLLYRSGAAATAELTGAPWMDWSIRGRVLAESEASALQALIVGCCASALLLAALTSGFRASPSRAAPPPGLRWRVGASALLPAAALALSLVGIPSRAPIWPFWFQVFLLGWTAVLALDAAERWPDEPRRELAARDLLSRAATLALAGLLTGWATALFLRAQGLDALGAQISPESLASHAQLRSGELRLLLATPILAALLVLPFAPTLAALSPASGRLAVPLAGLAPPLGAALSALLSLGVIVGLSGRQLAAAHQLPVVEGSERLQTAGLQLPTSERFRRYTLNPSPELTGAALLVSPTGALLGSPSARRPARAFDDALFTELGKASDDLGAPAEPLLAVDHRQTFGSIRTALAPLLDRRQTAFRWVVAPAILPALDAARPTLGKHEDVLGWAALRDTFQIELIERVEVTRSPGASPRKVVAVRSSSDQLSSISMTGAFGAYRRSPHARPETHARLSLSDDKSVFEIDFSRYLAGLLFAADEWVLVLPPGADAGSISDLMLELRWLADVGHRLRRSGRMGPPPPRHTDRRTLILTTSSAPFD